MINAYHTQISKLNGTDYGEVLRKAHTIYNRIASKTKRKPYVRSVYFKKEKVFLDYFWQHLQQTNRRDSLRRIRFYACALDLVMNSHAQPLIEQNRNKPSEMLYRFAGVTKEKDVFFVQIKENIHKKNKYFISVFPK